MLQAIHIDVECEGHLSRDSEGHGTDHQTQHVGIQVFPSAIQPRHGNDEYQTDYVFGSLLHGCQALSFDVTVRFMPQSHHSCNFQNRQTLYCRFTIVPTPLREHVGSNLSDSVVIRHLIRSRFQNIWIRVTRTFQLTHPSS